MDGVEEVDDAKLDVDEVGESSDEDGTGKVLSAYWAEVRFGSGGAPSCDRRGEGGGEAASYDGGGTNDAFLLLGSLCPAPESKAACKSDAYRF